MPRPWNFVPITDCGEELVSLPEVIKRLEPHPYMKLGAPYGSFADPWRLRGSVLRRLILAQGYLQSEVQSLRLAVFDAWRPIAVQAFMLEHCIHQECMSRGIDRFDKKEKVVIKEIEKLVGQFWALPSLDPSMPPPHSTGAAVDLTLFDVNGSVCSMGGDIDAIGSISEPNYYHNALPNSQGETWHNRRMLLAKVMTAAGFVQHPNEWWHFSFGDQLWAWRQESPNALYGACRPSSSKSDTA